MNKLIKSVIFSLTFFFAVGCSSILNNNEGIFGKKSKQTQVLDAQIRSVENAQAQVNEEKLAHIGAWSKGGVEYSLDQIKTNVPKEVSVAKEMNDRIQALAGKPDFKEVEAIKGMVDSLLSENDKIRKKGEKDLADKDKEINKLETKIKQLDTEREDQIAKIMAQSKMNASQADQYKASLNQMDRWFGFGAIYYGLKKFLISSAWVLGIGSILFLILRILSTTNPIASAVFSIFNMIGSWMIHTVEWIFPKAVTLAGNVSTALFNSYKSTLTKLVDAIQLAKNNATASGKTATLEEALNEAAKSMNSDEKAIVDEIKKALNWK